MQFVNLVELVLCGFIVSRRNEGRSAVDGAFEDKANELPPNYGNKAAIHSDDCVALKLSEVNPFRVLAFDGCRLSYPIVRGAPFREGAELCVRLKPISRD